MLPLLLAYISTFQNTESLNNKRQLVEVGNGVSVDQVKVLPTYTALPGGVHLEACVAVTLVRSQHVLTHTVMTDVRVQGTLVNIWEKVR